MKFKAERMDKIKQEHILEVEAETVEVEVVVQQPYEEMAEVKSHTSYAHHEYYGDGYTAPELPQARKPYESSKARMWLVVSSMSLLAVTMAVVQNVEAKLGEHNQMLPMPVQTSLGQQRIAETMDLLAKNTNAFEKTLTDFGKVVENKKALVEVETTLHKQRQTHGKALSDDEARDLLIRAGYSPTKITEEQMASFKKRYNGVEGDVDFARDVAGDIVKEEVESFVHKARLISNVGEYIYNRINEN